ncbi:unnamed protein product [Amoebophrya sp. A120]|nr:unnamed protein product [Amoebophrya sp. A120]|eukprot:GSA120T00008480001.1
MAAALASPSSPSTPVHYMTRGATFPTPGRPDHLLSSISRDLVDPSVLSSPAPKGVVASSRTRSKDHLLLQNNDPKSMRTSTRRSGSRPGSRGAQAELLEQTATRRGSSSSASRPSRERDYEQTSARPSAAGLKKTSSRYSTAAGRDSDHMRTEQERRSGASQQRSSKMKSVAKTSQSRPNTSTSNARVLSRKESAVAPATTMQNAAGRRSAASKKATVSERYSKYSGRLTRNDDHGGESAGSEDASSSEVAQQESFEQEHDSTMLEDAGDLTVQEQLEADGSVVDENTLYVRDSKGRFVEVEVAAAAPTTARPQKTSRSSGASCKSVNKISTVSSSRSSRRSTTATTPRTASHTSPAATTPGTEVVEGMLVVRPSSSRRSAAGAESNNKNSKKLSSKEFFAETVQRTVSAISNALEQSIAGKASVVNAGAGCRGSGVSIPSSVAHLPGEQIHPGSAVSRSSVKPPSFRGSVIPAAMPGMEDDEMITGDFGDIQNYDQRQSEVALPNEEETSFLYDKSGRPVMPSPFGASTAGATYSAHGNGGRSSAAAGFHRDLGSTVRNSVATSTPSPLTTGAAASLFSGQQQKRLSGPGSTTARTLNQPTMFGAEPQEQESLLTSMIGSHRVRGFYGEDVDWCKPYYIVDEESCATNMQPPSPVQLDFNASNFVKNVESYRQNQDHLPFTKSYTTFTTSSRTNQPQQRQQQHQSAPSVKMHPPAHAQPPPPQRTWSSQTLLASNTHFNTNLGQQQENEMLVANDFSSRNSGQGQSMNVKIPTPRTVSFAERHHSILPDNYDQESGSGSGSMDGFNIFDEAELQARMLKRDSMALNSGRLMMASAASTSGPAVSTSTTTSSRSKLPNKACSSSSSKRKKREKTEKRQHRRKNRKHRSSSRTSSGSSTSYEDETDDGSRRGTKRGDSDSDGGRSMNKPTLTRTKSSFNSSSSNLLSQQQNQQQQQEFLQQQLPPQRLSTQDFRSPASSFGDEERKLIEHGVVKEPSLMDGMVDLLFGGNEEDEGGDDGLKFSAQTNSTSKKAPSSSKNSALKKRKHGQEHQLQQGRQSGQNRKNKFRNKSYNRTSASSRAASRRRRRHRSGGTSGSSVSQRRPRRRSTNRDDKDKDRSGRRGDRKKKHIKTAPPSRRHRSGSTSGDGEVVEGEDLFEQDAEAHNEITSSRGSSRSTSRSRSASSRSGHSSKRSDERGGGGGRRKNHKRSDRDRHKNRKKAKRKQGSQEEEEDEE